MGGAAHYKPSQRPGAARRGPALPGPSRPGAARSGPAGAARPERPGRSGPAGAAQLGLAGLGTVVYSCADDLSISPSGLFQFPSGLFQWFIRVLMVFRRTPAPFIKNLGICKICFLKNERTSAEPP